MVKNRKCLTDSTQYSYCPDCSGKDKIAPAWKSEFCCEDCMLIWTTATKYNMGRMTKLEAKEVLSTITLKPMDVYTKCVQRDLRVILAEEKKTKKAQKKVEPVVDVVPNEPEQQEVAEDPAVEATESHEVVNKTNENE